MSKFILRDETISISNFSQISSFQNFNENQKCSFICENCKKQIVQSLRSLRRKTKLLCKQCQTKFYNLEHFGCENISQRQDVKQKKIDVCKQRFGVDNISQVKDIQNKKKETLKKKYGNESWFATETFKQKYKQTCKEKCGVEHCSQAKEIKIKQVRSWKKSEKHCKQKYRETCLKKYGADNFMKSKHAMSHYKRGLEFEGEWYDSKLELAVAEFLKSKNIDFERQVKYPKTFEVDGIDHITFVDFYLPKTKIWIECKGSQFFDKDGNAEFVYGSKSQDAKVKENFKNGKLIWIKKLAFLKEEKVLLITNGKSISGTTYIFDIGKIPLD